MITVWAGHTCIYYIHAGFSYSRTLRLAYTNIHIDKPTNTKTQTNTERSRHCTRKSYEFANIA